jgi:hypothetical protein
VDELARAVRDRQPIQEKDFANTLSECESCQYDAKVPAATALRLVQSLFDYEAQLKLARTPKTEKKAWKRS